MAKGSRRAKPRRVSTADPTRICAAPAALIIVEAVNFTATAFDTNDISTIRGSSLALLRMVDAVDEALRPMATPDHRFTVLTRGASVYELVIDGPRDAALQECVATLLARAREIVSYPISAPDEGEIDLARFTILAVAARADELPDGAPPTLAALLALARTRLRVQQTRARRFAMPHPIDLPDWSVSQAAGDCAARSGLRGVVIDRRGHGADRFEERVSAGVLDRRLFGRSARRGIWLRLLREAGEAALVDRIIHERIDFADQLRHLLPNAALDPPHALTPAISGKIALIHLDGNGFGAKRALLKDAASHGALSDRLRAIHARLIARVIGDALDEGGNGARLWADGDVRRVRIEPLLLGGDELVIAVPAFCALPLLALMQDHLIGDELDEDWLMESRRAEDRRLTHAAAIVLANQKTPIRHLRSAAADLVDLVKLAASGRKGFATGILTMEGFALPHGGIEAVLDNHYAVPHFGVGDSWVKYRAEIADAIGFPAGDGTMAPWRRQLRLLCELRANLPISQAIKLLRAANEVADWRAHVASELGRIRSDPATRQKVAALLECEELGWRIERPTTPLRHYVLLHDYLPDWSPISSHSAAARVAA